MKTLDQETHHAVSQFVELIKQHFDVQQVIVFGSRARGDHQADSDIDVAVLLRGPTQRMVPTSLAMTDLAHDVLLDTGLLISPLPIWLDQWNHPNQFSNPILLSNIANEGIQV